MTRPFPVARAFSKIPMWGDGSTVGKVSQVATPSTPSLDASSVLLTTSRTAEHVEI